jgi:hypothetical protein
VRRATATGDVADMQFDMQFQAGKIPQQHSHEVEQDYLE